MYHGTFEVNGQMVSPRVRGGIHAPDLAVEGVIGGGGTDGGGDSIGSETTSKLQHLWACVLGAVWII